MSDLKFSQTHEWAKVEGNIATIGITDFAIQQLSDLVYIGLPKINQIVKAGEPFGEIESVKAVSDLNAPLSGEVIEINEQVTSNLDMIAKEPYGKGWLVKIKIANPAEESNLLSAEAYKKLCDESKH